MLNSGALDFEAAPVFRLTVRASDGTTTDTATITVNLRDLAEGNSPEQGPETLFIPPAVVPAPQTGATAGEGSAIPSVGIGGVPVARGNNPLGLAVDPTVAPANLRGFGGLNPADIASGASDAAGTSAAGTRSTVTSLNTLPPPAAGAENSERVTDDVRGFPVVRLAPSNVPASARTLVLDTTIADGAHRLFVFMGVPSGLFAVDGSGAYNVPQDAFAHTDPAAIVRLEARLASGAPLPTWLRFDAARGLFTGVPPEGLRGELEIEVIAKDTEERTANTSSGCRLTEVKVTEADQAHGADDSKLGLSVDKEEAEKAAAEKAAAERSRSEAGEGVSQPPLGEAATGKAGSDAKAVKRTVPFSEQMRLAKAARDPLLSRIGQTATDRPTNTR